MPLPTLILTCFIKESETPGVFIGRITEIGGIFAQANSRADVYDDLVRNTYIMRRYKEEEFQALLRKQLMERFEELFADNTPHFHLEVRDEVTSEVSGLAVA